MVAGADTTRMFPRRGSSGIRVTGGAALLSLVALMGGCGRIWYDPQENASDDGGSSDGAIDGSRADGASPDAPSDPEGGATDGGDAGAPSCSPGVRMIGPVTSCPFYCHNARVLWNGDGYMLCWEQEVSADIGGRSPIFCGALDRAGTMLGAPFAIEASTSSRSLSLQRGADGLYALSFVDNATGDWEVYLTQFDATGAQTTTRVTNVPGTGWGTSLVWTGTEYGVAWYDTQNGDTTSDIYFTRVAPGGTVSPQTRITDLGTQRGFTGSLAWTGTEYVVGWRDIRDSGTWDVYIARLDASGTRLSDDVRITDDTMLTGGPKLIWTGTHLAMLFDDMSGTDDVWFARADASGAPIGSAQPITVAAGVSAGATMVARGAAGFVATWFDDRAGSLQLYALILDADGAPEGSELVLPSSPFFSGPEPSSGGMTWTGDRAVVVWSDVSGGDAEIFMAEICP